MEATRFLVTEKIGQNTGWTDEKFLICYSVPIARIGVLIYGPSERPECAPGADGLIRVERSVEDVFEAASVASLQGKSFINEHVVGDVNPDNYRDVTAGTVINPRRGEGVFDDCVVADIIVMDAPTIQDILGGKREVSAGYDCKYFVLGPGRARQTHIRFNHVALVESGRCGPRCSIHDHAMKEKSMGKKPFAKLFTLLRSLRSGLPEDQRHTYDEALTEAEEEETKKETKDEEGEGLGKRMDELESKHATHDARLCTHDKKHATHDARLDAIEGKIGGEKKGDGEGEEDTKDGKAGEKEDKEIESELKEEAPSGSGDRAMKAHDSAYLAQSYQRTIALAEIIAPGIRIPTFDGKGDPKVTYRDLCAFRKRALSLGLLTTDTSAVIEEVRGGRTLDANELGRMKCDEARKLFLAVGAVKKAANTRDTSSGHFTNTEGCGGGLGVASKFKTPAEINEANKARFSGK